MIDTTNLIKVQIAAHLVIAKVQIMTFVFPTDVFFKIEKFVLLRTLYVIINIDLELKDIITNLIHVDSLPGDFNDRLNYRLNFLLDLIISL